MKPSLPLCLGLLTLAACGSGSGIETPEAGATLAATAEDGRAYASGARRAAPGPNAVVPGEAIVMLVTGVPIEAVLASHGLGLIDRFGQRPIYRLSVPASQPLETVLAALRADGRVRFAEANVESETPEGRHQIIWAMGEPGAYTGQWAPNALALPQAHTWSTGVGVRVAVLDGGVDLNHPRLVSAWARDAAGDVLGRDFVDDDADPSENAAPTDAGWGHGTHVAGLVNLAAPGALLMPARVLDRTGRGNVWVLAEALMWAVDPDANPSTDDGARVVNISIGTTQATRLLNTAIELATCSDDDDNEEEDDYSDPGFDADRERCNVLRGSVVMAAAGNAGSSTERQYPAAEAAEGQLAVTAHNRNRRLPAFANRGPWVQLAAPGQGVVSTMPGNQYASWSGTSMSTPLAAGVAALVLAREPDWKPVDVTKRLLDRSIALCDTGSTGLRGLHAWGAVADFVPTDPVCR
jgi:subtilisin family serine protease